jgi:deoxyadenosine/deoxycytidine kinase
MKNSKGKIIAVVGAPATGKSTLVRFLQKEYGFKTILEGEESDVPAFIKDNINQNKNGLQTIIWFHNRLVEQYSKALDTKRKGHTIVLDTFWLSNLFYISTMLKDKNEKNTVINMIKVTEKYFPYPDIIIYLKSDLKTIREWMSKRGRTFEKKLKIQVEIIHKEHEIFFGNKKILKGAKIIKMDVAKEDPKEVLKKLNLK